METEHATKRQLREAQRRAEHVPRRCVNRWLLFVQKVLWKARRQFLDAIFTTYMQTQLIAKQGAQRQLCDLLVRAWASHLHRRARLLHRLQDLFWRAWTCRQFDLTTSWGQSLGKCSRRDAYIYHRAAALVPQLIKHGIIADHDAAANSRVVNISDARRSGGRTAGTRKVDEAGIPATPGSARSRKKRSGRR